MPARRARALLGAEVPAQRLAVAPFHLAEVVRVRVHAEEPNERVELADAILEGVPVRHHFFSNAGRIYTGQFVVLALILCASSRTARPTRSSEGASRKSPSPPRTAEAASAATRPRVRERERQIHVVGGRVGESHRAGDLRFLLRLSAAPASTLRRRVRRRRRRDASLSASASLSLFRRESLSSSSPPFRALTESSARPPPSSCSYSSPPSSRRSPPIRAATPPERREASRRRCPTPPSSRLAPPPTSPASPRRCARPSPIRSLRRSGRPDSDSRGPCARLRTWTSGLPLWS